MARLKEKTIIKRRKENLMKIFSDIDGDKMTLVEPSIEQTAKMEQYIMRLSEQLDEVGFIEEYQNGENQKGKKESTESKAYSTMVKNYNAIIRTLLSCLPETDQKQAEDEVLDYLKRRV